MQKLHVTFSCGAVDEVEARVEVAALMGPRGWDLLRRQVRETHGVMHRKGLRSRKCRAAIVGMKAVR